MRVYLFGAGAVALFFAFINVRFRRKMRANRIEEISGKLREQYLEVCKTRKVKPIPVWFADPLPSACLVGVFRPYIALPLTAAPQEAVHVLTHEICHYQGRDHLFSVLRLLCCVVHWFNPLVWLAAFMSRNDGELACDSRVVRPLSKEDRLNYTNTLVLAASKRYAPGVGVLATGMTMTGKKLQNRVRSILNFERAVKWLMITVAALACAAFAAAFFTAESYTFPQMPVFYASSATAAKPLESKEDALQLAKTFFAGDAFALDLTGYAWEVFDTDTTYEVQAYPDGDEMGMPVTMSVLKTGIITDFNVPSDFNRASPVNNMYAGDTVKQEEVAAYIAGFWAANQPGTADAMEAMNFEGEYAIAEMRFVSFYGINAASDTAYLTTVQVMPEVRMISFRTNSAMRRSLLGAGVTAGNPAPDIAASTETLAGMRAVDIAQTNSGFTAPMDGEMDAETALNAGLKAIADRYQETDISRFYVSYGFVSSETLPDATYQTPYWIFALRNALDSTDGYDIIVHANDGEILYLSRQGEGNG